uniref:Putative ixostatin n=1 Tax=Ixodes ricinus TaxID=34613 RepID=A0A0K8R381_IXORI
MIRMVILPLSVVLLAASGYIHATQTPKDDADECSRGLGDFITTVCSSSNATLTQFSECSYTCQSNNVHGQIIRTTHFLPNGLPCGSCKECCNGQCQSVKFELRNPLTLKTSCSA